MHAVFSPDLVTLFKRAKETLRASADQVSNRLAQARIAQNLLPQLKRTTEEKELKSSLHSATQALHLAQQHLRAIKAEGRWGQPIAWFHASKAVTTAALELADQQDWAFDASQLALRAQQVAAHNQQVEEVAQQFQELSQTMAQAKAWLTAGKLLQDRFDLLEQTLSRHGWVEGNTETVLKGALRSLLLGNVSQALLVTDQLRFQTMPTPGRIVQWVKETERVLEVARSEGGIGFTALAAFKPIVDDATALVLAGCTPNTQRAVQQDFEPVDRWYHLAHQLTTPTHVVHWVQWALYWASFQTSQRFSKDLSLADAHEEHSTGSFLNGFRAELERWAGPKIDAMGYPNVTAFMGTLALGGTTAEAQLGADFGIIVEINVGGLTVRKVALVQGKLSTNGTADIGSKPSGPGQLTQLEKLTDTQRDFYAFYHRGVRQASVPWPTVNRASALVTSVTNRQAGSIKISTRDGGWDWPSFMAFGLCSDDSGVGRVLEDHEDALDVLSGGRRHLLPGRLIVVAAGGADYSLNLQRRVHQHYSTVGTRFERTKDKDDGPEIQGPRWSR